MLTPLFAYGLAGIASVLAFIVLLSSHKCIPLS